MFSRIKLFVPGSETLSARRVRLAFGRFLRAKVEFVDRIGMAASRSSMLSCNSVSVDCSGVASPRFLAAAAVCLLQELIVVNRIGVAASKLGW